VNVERLHAVARALLKELTDTRLVETFQELVGSLQNAVNQPGQAQFQNVVANKRTELARSLPSTLSNTYSPAWRQIVAEIGGTGLLGNELLSRIDDIFQRNQITPAAAFQELQPILQELATFKTALTEATKGLVALKIGAEDLAPGECEVGVAIPREAIDNEFKTFADELEKFEFIFSTFLELSTGHRDPLPIRTLSSSAFMVYVGMAQTAAAAFAYAAERITLAYKNLMEARQIKASLEKINTPAEAIEQVERHVNGMMGAAVETIALEVEQKYLGVTDAGRRAELKTSLRVSLNRLANRIDRGYNLDVRIGPPTAEEQTDIDLEAARETIQSASVSLQFMRLEGPPILMLAEDERTKDSGVQVVQRSKRKITLGEEEPEQGKKAKTPD
jgi:hypothetical protein